MGHFRWAVAARTARMPSLRALDAASCLGTQKYKHIKKELGTQLQNYERC
jgi:hypothetical protein